MLIQREYAGGTTSRLIVEYGRVVSENPSQPHGFGPLTPETAVPFQKNPILSVFAARGRVRGRVAGRVGGRVRGRENIVAFRNRTSVEV
jgi:hypothetical protein